MTVTAKKRSACAAAGAAAGAAVGAGAGAAIGGGLGAAAGGGGGTLVAPSVGTVGGAVVGAEGGAAGGAEAGAVVGGFVGGVVGSIVCSKGSGPSFGGNDRENTQAADARRAAERITGKKFDRRLQRVFHDRITKQGFDYDKLVEEAVDVLRGE